MLYEVISIFIINLSASGVILVFNLKVSESMDKTGCRATHIFISIRRM